MASLRVALIGAGRIARHHAKWYSRCGCEVAGFAVSAPERVAERAEQLRQDCPEVGPGFASVQEMLVAVKPDLVSVCTPPECHYEHALVALRHGAHVMCEKPLVWGDDLEVARQQAADLCRQAAGRRKVLACNLQYSFAADIYRRWIKALGPGLETCQVEFESRGKGAERTPAEVWMELGPHALSLAFGMLPGYVLRPETLVVETAPRTVVARFDLAGPQWIVETQVRCAQRTEGDLVRRFGLNQRMLDYAGVAGAGGDFVTLLSRGDIQKEYPDLMRTSIEQFVGALRGDTEAQPVSGEVGGANLEAQLRVASCL